MRDGASVEGEQVHAPPIRFHLCGVTMMVKSTWLAGHSLALVIHDPFDGVERTQTYRMSSPGPEGPQSGDRSDSGGGNGRHASSLL